MKILSEVKYNAETCFHEHDVLVASAIPFASMEMLEEMFLHLDLQVTQVSLPGLGRLRVLTEVDGQWAEK
jgi:hypothetical protein